ncbi:MAG: hypothetical protein HYW88_00690, partial [Candidatus Sungbacteria bacterium]|nr:hypothetical protein [Candidatus Sungbacteria bacterium]
WDEDVGTKKGLEAFTSCAEKSQEFKPLSKEQTELFIEKEAKKRGILLGAKDVQNLLGRFKNNLWGIVGELEKLSLGGVLAGASILNADEKIYTFLDSLILKQKNAPRLLFSLYEAGLEELYVFASIINEYRLLLLAKIYESNPEMLARVQKELNVHSFVLKKLQAQAKKFDIETLRTLYKRIPSFDHALKIRNMNLEEVVFELLNTPYRVSTNKK